MDDAFVNLCRQIISKDMATAQVREMERGDRARRPQRKKKRKRPGKVEKPGGCNIL